MVAFVSRTCIKVYWHEALWSHLQSLEAVLAGGRGVFFALRTLRELWASALQPNPHC